MPPTIWQFIYNGYTFGGANPANGIGVTHVTGIDDQPPVRDNDQERARLDGSFAGLDLASPRIVTIDFALVNLGDGNYLSNVEAWVEAFVQQPSTPQPLDVLIGGWAPSAGNPSGARRLYCRPRKRLVPWDQIFSVALAETSVELRAPDPLLYEAAATVVPAAASIVVPNPGDWPAGAGSTNGIITLTVSAASTLTGPGGGSITFTGTGPWVVDLSTHQVTGGNGYSDITQPPTWFTIPPGGGTVAVTAGTVSATTRGAWL